MHDLFISYAREDEAWVEKFHQILDGEGLKVWKDSAIPTGKPYGRVIEEAIAVARAVVVVWSQAAVESDWVRAEATEGLRRGVLLPVRRDESLPPMRFRTIQTIDLADWDFEPEHPGFRRLVGDLKSLLQQTSPVPAKLEMSRGEQTRPSKIQGKRHIWALAGVLVALIVAGSLWLWMDARSNARLAVELTAASRATLDEVADKYHSSRLYWHYFLDQKQGQALIERSVLLALEAVRAERSAEALGQLRQSLALLPRPLQKFGEGRIGVEAEIAPGADWVAWASQRGITLVESRKPAEVRELQWQGRVAGLIFSAKGDYLIALGDGGALKLWQLDSGKELLAMTGDGERALGFALDGSGSRIVLRQTDRLNLRKLPSGEQIAEIVIDGELPHQAQQNTLDFSADGRTLAFATGRDLVVWDVDKQEARLRLAFDNQPTALSFDPTGERLLALSADGEARLINLTDGQTSSFSVDPDTQLVRFAAADDWLALASAGKVRVVALNEPATALLDYGHADAVTRIEFDKDGNLLASAGLDGMVRVWEIQTKTELIRFGFRDRVIALRFAADGKSVLAIDRRGQLSEWPVGYQDPADEACRALQRNLTPEEWRLYLPGEEYRSSCELAQR